MTDHARLTVVLQFRGFFYFTLTSPQLACLSLSIDYAKGSRRRSILYWKTDVMLDDFAQLTQANVSDLNTAKSGEAELGCEVAVMDMTSRKPTAK